MVAVAHIPFLIAGIRNRALAIDSGESDGNGVGGGGVLRVQVQHQDATV